MASRDHRQGYSKHFGDRLSHLTESSTEDDVRLVYEDWAGQYDKEVLSAGLAFHKPVVEFFDASVNEVFPDKAKCDVRTVDAGAGTGLVGVELNKLGYTNIDALDISQEMLNEAKKKNVYRNYICASLSDQRTPGIEPGEYDALICVGTLVYAHVKPAAFVEMIRMIRNGGLVCFTLRSNEIEDFSGKMDELGNQGRWKLIKEIKVPPLKTCRASVMRLPTELLRTEPKLKITIFV